MSNKLFRVRVRVRVRALLSMVRQDCFISAQALIAQTRNLYGMRAGWNKINKQLLSRAYHAERPTRETLLTANHHRLRLDGHRGGRTCQACHLCCLGYAVYLVSASSKGARIKGSKLVVFRYTSGELSTVVLNRLLCSPTDTSPVSSAGAFCKIP